LPSSFIADERYATTGMIGSTVQYMDAQAQAAQDAAREADDNMNDMSLRPVDRKSKAKSKSKAQKNDTSITKDRTVTVDRSSAAKTINKQETEQPIKMTTPATQDVADTTAIPVKRRIGTKKEKSLTVAEKIKRTVTRKGAKVTKDELPSIEQMSTAPKPRGRPRKNPQPNPGEGHPKPRGRPRKNTPLEPNGPPKKRGRPPKKLKQD